MVSGHYETGTRHSVRDVSNSSDTKTRGEIKMVMTRTLEEREWSTGVNIGNFRIIRE